ncbi:MAG: hypothetical protein ACK5LN_00825 [Propioniciclava sp.]
MRASLVVNCHSTCRWSALTCACHASSSVVDAAVLQADGGPSAMVASYRDSGGGEFVEAPTAA